MIEGKNKEALLLASRLLVDNGLDDWHFAIKSATSFLGMTSYKQKLITFSSRFIQIATVEQFMGVTYHEVAHAIVGGLHNHDYVFQAKYYELSGNTDFAKRSANVQIKRYLATCSECGSIGSRNNTRKVWCKKCWMVKHKQVPLELTPNPLTLVQWET